MLRGYAERHTGFITLGKLAGTDSCPFVESFFQTARTLLPVCQFFELLKAHGEGRLEVFLAQMAFGAVQINSETLQLLAGTLPKLRERQDHLLLSQTWRHKNRWRRGDFGEGGGGGGFSLGGSSRAVFSCRSVWRLMLDTGNWGQRGRGITFLLCLRG